jgi:hypothetical protein
MRISGSLLADGLINNYMKTKICPGVIPETELEDYKAYLHQSLLLDGSSEYIIFECFDENFFAKEPLENRLG